MINQAHTPTQASTQYKSFNELFNMDNAQSNCACCTPHAALPLPADGTVSGVRGRIHSRSLNLLLP